MWQPNMLGFENIKCIIGNIMWQITLWVKGSHSPFTLLSVLYPQNYIKCLYHPSFFGSWKEPKQKPHIQECKMSNLGLHPIEWFKRVISTKDFMGYLFYMYVALKGLMSSTREFYYACLQTHFFVAHIALCAGAWSHCPLKFATTWQILKISWSVSMPSTNFSITLWAC